MRAPHNSKPPHFIHIIVRTFPHEAVDQYYAQIPVGCINFTHYISIISLSCSQGLSKRGRGSRSSAADTRRNALLHDPMCIIINPHLTKCRGCGVEIKLSPKMLFDTCHWVAHSKRCPQPLSPENSAPNFSAVEAAEQLLTLSKSII
jgi:hypothetical protein